jgi:hypothetical protein
MVRVLFSSLSSLDPRLAFSLNCSVVDHIPLTTDPGARGQLLWHNAPPTSRPRRERLRLWNPVYQQSLETVRRTIPSTVSY